MLNRKNLYYAACTFFAFIICWLLYIRAKLVCSYSVDLDGAEFGFVYYTQLLLQGKPLYPNPNEFPFLPVLFAPLYPYLMYCISLVLHYDYIHDIHNILVTGRALALAGLFVNAFFIYKLFKQFNLSAFYFLAAITVYLLLITGHFYATRPDALRTFAFTVFLYGVVQYLFYEGRIKYFLLALFSGLSAVFLKQDAVFSVLLMLFLLCLNLRDKKTYILFSVFLIGILLSVFSWRLVFGEYFFDNTVLFNFQVITQAKNSVHVLLLFFSLFRIFPLLALTVFSAYRALKRRRDKTFLSFLPLASLAYVIIIHIGMLKAGSNLNNSYDVLLLLVLNAALVIHHYEKTVMKYLKTFSLLMVGYVVILFASNTVIHTYSYNSEKEEKLKSEYFTILEERKQILDITKNDVLFPLNAKNIIFFAHAPIICGYDFHLYRILEIELDIKMDSKLLFVSPDEYDAWFNDGRVPYIAAINDERNKNAMAKYYAHYAPYKQLKHFVIYKFGE